jgi:hypothetical protein
MTSLQEIQGRIEESGHQGWIPFTDRGTWTFRDDVSLRIQRENQVSPNIQAPWTRNLQAGSQSFSYTVYYGNSPVEVHTIASVDNFRAHIPMPQQPQGPNEPYTITPYQATLGRIITGEDQTFEAYLNRTGIEIQE